MAEELRLLAWTNCMGKDPYFIRSTCIASKSFLQNYMQFLTPVAAWLCLICPPRPPPCRSRRVSRKGPLRHANLHHVAVGILRISFLFVSVSLQTREPTM